MHLQNTQKCLFPVLDSCATTLTIYKCFVSCKMNDLKDKVDSVRRRVESACSRVLRNASEITILAASKRHPASRIRALYACGQRVFGENLIGEALDKQLELEGLDVEWHFIGPLQSRKTREVARHFHWVQSVDREKTLLRLSGQRPESLPKLNVCIQVNIDQEVQKSGVMPEDLPELARLAGTLDNIHLRGLMAIPKPLTADHDPTDSFRCMRNLFENLKASGFQLDTLSMGMSADLELAIGQGSTMVRIGTDLLGPRQGQPEDINSKEAQ
jgi:pyridoxal phosphate enzyme (YggS family)